MSPLSLVNKEKTHSDFNTGCMSFEDWAAIEKQLRNSTYGSNLNVFKKSAGYRKAELSTIISPYGNGKSTFTRTAILDFLQNGIKVLVILSEEKASFYKKDLWLYFYFKTRKNEKETNDIMKNLILVSSIEGSFSCIETNKELRSYLNEMICTEEIEAVFFDNFTTSPFGSASITEQGKSIILLKKVAVEFDIPVILVLHTAKGTDTYAKVITGEDVRGNAASANIGSYNYIIMTFFRLEKPRAFVVIDKARYHGEANKKVYELEYDKDLKLYMSDKESSFDEIVACQQMASGTAKKKKGF